MSLRVKKVWHEGCNIVFNGEAHQEAQPKNKKRRNSMNGLIKQTKLDGLSTAGSFAIALFSVAAVLAVLASAFTGIRLI